MPESTTRNRISDSHLAEIADPTRYGASADYWLNSIQGRIYRRRVTSDGTIQIDRHTYAIGSAYRQQPVAAHILGMEFIVEYQGVMIKQLPIRGLYGQHVLFDSYLILLREEARILALHYQNLWRKAGDIR